MIKKLLNDWRVATPFEKARFILVISLELMTGICCLYYATMFLLTVDYNYLIVCLVLLVIVASFGFIKLSPRNKE